MNQLSLTLPPTPDQGGDRFVIAPCNEQAFRLVDSWPGWPAASLAVCGPAGSGKSLLAELWAVRADAARLDGRHADVDQAMALAYGARPLYLEHPDAFAPQSLLHLLNAVSERGGSLLLTHRLAPSHWQAPLPDLRSRLAALPVAALEKPDDGLLRAILVKIFSARQVRVSPDLLDYVLARCERSAEAVASVAEQLDAAALAQGRPITLALARTVLVQSSET